ncbi:ketohydroxyglutarate aldolase [Actinoplanes lobatus]|uniref:2-dehydro-3-deoxyphosphogluconate aldolase/(4S)-4-hydroxy-2-oxoglutarate aldolase n=1 Tax=Actinoplanes lobatus TaxID=113568 RepID=A0A7W7HJQ1_9ACTN|nr:bifunctional 4-hydroxy-2-oxoglutarate aldolase/2-dehydro-3-deoxy-phosphogluconate aldolase [Actinoplanes lobatus]MBB4751797.1 2-dehydro-3-deoxyphosphogluconate aldolase/(4S)-4-hydroxy-2-oxoglutarate aldolase [Actinoplanes lobatus]GGN65788.1 ketohydroxyglutarate aldolase [Actinoplanes lobatus]GIE43377.1 ketohydroxyglutarate aldolase [Actinoplanes lobatus]
MNATDVLQGHRVVPVVVLEDPDRADDLGAALVAGGLPVAEATFRTPRAAAVLQRLARRGDLIVGAGTVITARQVDLAHSSGARFVVSPGLSAGVVRRCQDLGLPVIPGVSTASEVMAALDLGVDTVKFFPAEASGGLPTVKALSAAFPQVRFVPTGGITERNAPDYLAHPAVAAVGGSWMVAPGLLADGRWDEVAARCSAVHDLQGAAP